MTRSKSEVSPEVLDRCLTDIQVDQTGIGAASSRFPEAAESLGALLETAERVRAEMAPADPDAAFVRASRARVLHSVRVSLRGKTQGAPRMSWRPAYALAVVLLVGLLIGGAGVVQASAEALPGGSLYGVKRAVEEAQLVLTWSAGADAVLMERFAEDRLSEASTMAAAGRSDDVALALEGYNDMIDRLTALAETSGLAQGPGSLAQVQVDLERNVEVLQEVSSRAPAAAQEHIGEAIERSHHNQAVIEQLSTGGNPSELAPGRQRTPKEAGDEPGGDQEQEAGSTPGPKEKTRTPGPPAGAGARPTKDKEK